MKDSMGREVNYLRISITDKCNLRCLYCMPDTGVPVLKHEDVLTIEEMLEIVRIFIKLGIQKVRITGGEPLVKKGLLNLIAGIRNLGIEEIAMTSNGILLAEQAFQLKEAGLKRINISLDTLDPDKYRRITRGGDLTRVLKGIETAKEAGLTPIKINVVLIKGFNDNEILDFTEMTRQEDIHVRFIELMPIGEGIHLKDSYLSNEEVLRQAPSLLPLVQRDQRAPAKYYQLPGGLGKVGLINPLSSQFCGSCNRIRLNASGQIRLCLHDIRFLDIKSQFRSGGDIEAVIREAIFHKPKNHHLEQEIYNTTNMNQIGG